MKTTTHKKLYKIFLHAEVLRHSKFWYELHMNDSYHVNSRHFVSV